MTRLAYVCADPGVPVFGAKGCSIHVQEMVRAFDRAGVSVELFAARRGGEPDPDLSQVPVYDIETHRGVATAARERALRRSSERAAAQLAELGPFDLVYERYSLWSCAPLERARRQGWPSVIELNAPLPDEQRRHRRLFDHAAAESIAGRAIAAATVGVAVSEPVAEWARARTPAPARIVTVPNGVDVDAFSHARHRRRPQRSFTIGFVGSLKPWHGVGILVDAFRSLAELDESYRLVIVGDGPQLPTVREALRDAGLLDRAQLLGAVPHSEIPDVMASFDVATAPYTDEGDEYFSPLKIVEYFAAGLPVVASSAGYDDPIVIDKVTALLSPPGDAGALARHIAAIRADSQLARRLGEAGHATVVETRSWQSVAQRVLALAASRKPTLVGAR